MEGLLDGGAVSEVRGVDKVGRVAPGLREVEGLVVV